jgi:hypothetical protein
VRVEKLKMAIKDDVAELSNGAHVSYLDTGIPDGKADYRTFIFIPGASHNKCMYFHQWRY